MKISKSGFTIVELLIVIVVIGILAVITVVAYNGIQQRASNTKIISAARQSVQAIQAYIAANDKNPGNTTCITPTCHWGATTPYTTRPAVIAALQSVSSLPDDIPSTSSTQDGIILHWSLGRTFNDTTSPTVIQYWLFGNNTQCGLPNVTNGISATMTSSTTGYTSSYGDNRTSCTIAIPANENI